MEAETEAHVGVEALQYVVKPIQVLGKWIEWYHLARDDEAGRFDSRIRWPWLHAALYPARVAARCLARWVVYVLRYVRPTRTFRVVGNKTSC